jgi:imipenem/basic amino acid-specific outer membrane pore
MNIRNFLAIFYFLTFFVSLYAEDDTQKHDKFGELSGLIRFYYIFEPSYVKSGRTNDYAINGSAIGGHLRYTTPTFSNFGASTALYYAQDTGLNNKSDPDTMMAAGRFFTRDYSAKAVLGELNAFYKNKEHHAVIGRQKINSPLTNAIYTYMPNMFESIYYENSQIENTKLVFLHIDKMAYGTRAPVEFGLIGETTRTAGATQNALDIRGDFLPIEQQILADDTADTNGITGFAFTNNSLPNTTVRLWDFYAYDIINMFYLDAEYKNKFDYLSYSISAQYLNIHSVGKNLASAWLDADNADLFGAKFALKYNNIYTYIAYNHSGNAKLLNPWGGDPAYTSSIFSRNAYRANVDAFKLGVTVSVTKNFKIIASHADYGQSTTEGTFSPSKPVEAPAMPRGDAIESSLLFSYNPISSLNILTGAIYKTSEYFYSNEQVKLLDLDLLITYKFNTKG